MPPAAARRGRCEGNRSSSSHGAWWVAQGAGVPPCLQPGLCPRQASVPLSPQRQEQDPFPRPPPLMSDASCPFSLRTPSMLPAPAHPLAPPRSPLSPCCPSTTPLPKEAFGGLSRAPLLCPEPALTFEHFLSASHSFTRCWPLGWGGCKGRRGRIPTGEPRPPGPEGLCAERPPLLTAQGLSPGPWDSNRQSAHPKDAGAHGATAAAGRRSEGRRPSCWRGASACTDSVRA